MLHLPDELILQIIAYLEPAELVNLAHVSRQFLNLSRDNKLWKQLCFAHSYTERRRRRLEITPAATDPRLAELIEAANSLAGSFDIAVRNPRAPGAEAEVNRNKEKRRAALLHNWDPSGPGERVNWYHEFVQRHAPPQLSWFQDAGPGDEDEARREATGAGILYDTDGRASRLIAPLDDGSIKIWDADAHSATIGRTIATSAAGLLTNSGPSLDRATRLAQSQAMMTSTGAVECVSIDSAAQRAFFAVQNTLTEIDLATLHPVARTTYPFPVTALSEAHPTTPLTIGTTWTLHLHDPRQRPPASPIDLPTASSIPISRLATGPSSSHASLTQPGPLSILHAPPSLGDGNGNIWVSGRFTSLLNFDRRYFPRLRGTLFSGARIASTCLIPTPFIPSTLRHGSPRALTAARETRGITLAAAGEYKGKGSLEMYSLSPEPGAGVNTAESRTGGDERVCFRNRQTCSASRVMCVAGHGTRVVFGDGEGNVKWVERDGGTPVRGFNVSDVGGAGGDIVQRILPTMETSLLGPASFVATGELDVQNLAVWTGDGRLGMVTFGAKDVFDVDTFEDALEHQVHGHEADTRAMQREYSLEMRKALEQQARELRWMRGYGL